MLRAVFFFELRYQLTRRSTLAFAALLFGYAALMVARASGLVGAPFDLLGDGGRAALNSPAVLHLLVTLPSAFGILLVAAVAVSAACRDVRHGSCALYYTKPVSERAYLGGRLAGALIVLAVVFTMPVLGLLAVTSLPGFPPDRLQPSQLGAFLMPYVAVVWPNLLALGTLVFCVAAARRREGPAYALSLALLGAWVVARAFGSDLAKVKLAILVDPFGYLATEAVMDRLSVAARHAAPVPLAGALLRNRAIWLSLAALGLLWLLARFRFTEATPSGRRRQQLQLPPASADERTRAAGVACGGRPPEETRGRRRPAIALLACARFELVRLLSQRAIQGGLAGLLVVGAVLSRTLGVYEGTPSHPVTFLVLGDLANSLLPLALLVILFAAGELVWRERDLSLEELCDASPARTVTRASAKLLALVGLILVVLSAVAVVGVAAQLSRGHLDLQLPLYASELLGFRLPTFVLLGVLAMTAHVLVNYKPLGHVAVAACYLLLSNRKLLDSSGGLAAYASDAGYVYSDFTGYEPFGWPFLVYKLYWFAAALLLGLLGVRLWPRGRETSLRARWRFGRREHAAHTARALAGLSAIAFVCLGTFIYQSTAVRNRSAADRVRDEIEYERRYRKHADLAQPRVSAVWLRVALQPRERRADIEAEYELENAGDRPIEALHLSVPDASSLRRASCSRFGRELLADSRLGYFVFTLAPRLAPGERIRARFDLALADRGFRFPQTAPAVLSNGTFLMSDQWAPEIGYQPARELRDPLLRRQYGLLPSEPLPPPDDPRALERGVHRDADRVGFEAVVSTDAPEQTVLAPGRLQRVWSEGARRFYAYRAEQPIFNHYAIVSARYATRREDWRGIALEVRHHPRHGQNAERVLRALRQSVAWHVARLGPCSYPGLRVVEIPRHAPFRGRSYPGLIPLVETGGFLAQMDGRAGEIDVLSSLVAHEVAHQWWGHAVAGAAARGGPFVQETLAQYSRLQLVATLDGEAAAARLLEYARLEYFRGRREAGEPEPPLVAVAAQPYVYYDKGMFVMHALAHRLGRERLESALASYFAKVAARRPPYGTSLDLVSEMRRVAATDEQSALTDLLERVTTYDVRLVLASSDPHGARYRVSARVALSKKQADAAGVEVATKPSDWVEVAVLGAGGEPLCRERLFLDRSQSELVVEVDRPPQRVVVDPDGLLLDPVVDDNEAKLGGS